MIEFQLLNITNEGRRGRPAHPKAHSEYRSVVMNERGSELGELTMEPAKDGSVVLTAVIDGKTKTVVFPAKKAARKPSKAKKVTAARKAKNQ